MGQRRRAREYALQMLFQIDLTGVAPEQVVHVGNDLRADVDGAFACGLATVWITRRVADADRRLREHTGAEPDFVIADLADLPGLIEQ